MPFCEPEERLADDADADFELRPLALVLVAVDLPVPLLDVEDLPDERDDEPPLARLAEPDERDALPVPDDFPAGLAPGFDDAPRAGPDDFVTVELFFELAPLRAGDDFEEDAAPLFVLVERFAGILLFALFAPAAVRDVDDLADEDLLDDGPLFAAAVFDEDEPPLPFFDEADFDDELELLRLAPFPDDEVLVGINSPLVI